MRKILFSLIFLLMSVFGIPNAIGDESPYLMSSNNGVTTVFNMDNREGFVFRNDMNTSLLITVYPKENRVVMYGAGGMYETTIDVVIELLKDKYGDVEGRVISKVIPIDKLV